MSSQLYDGLGGLPMDEELCVNPQYTDKRYHTSRENQSSIIPTTFMTPCPSRPNPNPRCPSLILSDATASCNVGPSSASSTSSFSSSPGYPTPSSSSVSTASSSRRHSGIYSDSQQYCLSDSSPTPAFRPGKSKSSLSVDQYSFQEPLTADPQSICSNARPFDGAGDVVSSNADNEFLVHVNDYAERAQMGWQDGENHLNALPDYELPGQTKASPYLGVDLMSNFSGSLAARTDDCSQSFVDYQQPSIFSNVLSSQGVMPPCTDPTSNPSPLGEPFQYDLGTSKDDMSASSDDDEDDEGYSTGLATNTCGNVKSFVLKRKSPKRLSSKKRHRSIHYDRYGTRSSICTFTLGGYDRACDRPDKTPCSYACNRREHLHRHVLAKHTEFPEPYECAFPDCIDKKTGKRRIIMARNDNFKAHYTRTHFSYGTTEKSGKNRRKSMKVSFENGLRESDNRWTRMLAGKLTMDPNIKGFLSVWKMMGYSIRETREIRVKDVAPDWQGPDETTLEAFDPRWKALKNGTLDYEQAMSVGIDMAETAQQGLLGVTMSETKEMGIDHLDVRWNLLLSGEMSIEDSEKLGVKHENPAWIVLQTGRKQ